MTTYPYKNLVFEGGGVKGIAYVGALGELEKHDILKNIERVGGTSAGAITAILVALKYTTEEIKEILWDLDFKKFMDDSFGILRDTHRLLYNFGFYKGDFFKIWISEIIEEKTGGYTTTFQEVHDMGFLDLYLIGSNLSTGYSEIFSHEHTPSMSVTEAARISMGIPLFFQAVESDEGYIYVDGGLFNNYPVKLFDNYGPKEETLGFRLDSKVEIETFSGDDSPETKRISDFFDYIQALFGALMNQQDSRHLHSGDWKRTVYIPCDGVGAIDFDINDDQKKQLVDSGIAGVKKYFDRYEDI